VRNSVLISSRSKRCEEMKRLYGTLGACEQEHAL